jgi:hypothetical protein
MIKQTRTTKSNRIYWGTEEEYDAGEERESEEG